jgi:membrane protein DedA with SNARE-associated domain
MSATVDWIFRHGYLGMYGLLAAGVIALPVPEDSTLIVAGCLVARGRWALTPTWTAAAAGCITGITLSYLLGRFVGLAGLKRFSQYVGLTAERRDRAEAWFHRVGKWSLLMAYWVPGIRHLAALTAGASHLRFRVFVLFAWSGACIWVTTFLSLGYWVGEEWERAVHYAHQPQLWLLIAFCAAVIALWLQWRRNQSPHPRRRQSPVSYPQRIAK